jgi:hypothetical protein
MLNDISMAFFDFKVVFLWRKDFIQSVVDGERLFCAVAANCGKITTVGGEDPRANVVLPPAPVAVDAHSSDILAAAAWAARPFLEPASDASRVELMATGELSGCVFFQTNRAGLVPDPQRHTCCRQR